MRTQLSADGILKKVKMLEQVEKEWMPLAPELVMAHREFGSDEERDGSLATAATRPKVAQPPLFKVVLLNDDYTPMEFVVEVLCSFFGMNVEKATQVMLKVHTEGKAVCGVFSKDVAETKAQQVNDYSRECEQPLLCNVEVDS